MFGLHSKIACEFITSGNLKCRPFCMILSQIFFRLLNWKSKPSFAVLATEDKSIRHEIQEKMQRSNTKVTRVKGSHAVYISQPGAVTKEIIEAAEAAK
jgi:hypothetical protein